MFGIDPNVIASTGLLFIALIIFAESGLVFGFFLPGDTLLIAVGVIAAAPNAPFTVEAAIFTIALAAIAGDNFSYTIGRLSGKRLFHKKDGILFRQEYIERSEKFYEKYGAKTMLFARFIGIVRTFAPLVAGISKMPRARFVFFDTIGAIIWATSITLLGYFVGSKIPHIGEYLEYAVIVVMVLAFVPIVWHIVRDPKSRAMIAAKFRRLMRRRKKHEAESTDTD